MTAVDYLERLGVALPLVLTLLGGSYYAVRRGWLRLPGAVVPGAPATAVRLVQAAGLGPGARLVVVEFDGRRLLLAAHRGGVSLIDSSAPRL